MKFEFPNIPKITKNVAVMIWSQAKQFPVDGILLFVTLGAIIYYAIDKQDKVSLDGAAAILFCYIIYTLYRLSDCKRIIKDQKGLIDKLTNK